MLFTPEQYASLRRLMAADPEWALQITWSENVKRPTTAEHMAEELIFVICNSGMKHTIARQIYDRVMDALEHNVDLHKVFGHAGKCKAISSIWARRNELFHGMQYVADCELPGWLKNIPFIGEITCYHAAKNLGANVVKPDRWIMRLAESVGEDHNEFCARLASFSGDRVATVDLVLWWAMAKGHLVPCKSAPPMQA